MEKATEPVGEIMSKASSGKKASHRLIHLLLSVNGFILIVFGITVLYKTNHDWVPEVCIPLGVAIMAPAILSYLYRRYLLEDIKEELGEPARKFKDKAIEMLSDALGEVTRNCKNNATQFHEDARRIIFESQSKIDLLQLVDKAGLVGIYPTRQEALSMFLKFLENEPYEIMVIGSSLRGLLQDHDKAYVDACNLLKEKGTITKFLLTHPKIADLRAQQEGRNLTDIGKEILISLKILIEDWKVPRENIKLYQGTPTCFGIKTEGAMLLNFYPYEKEAFASPCLVVKKGEYFYQHFGFSHFHAWSSALARCVPDNLEQIEGMLDTFADKIEELIELGKSSSGSAGS